VEVLVDVSVNYAIDAFMAMRDLREWPSILHPVVHWFLPHSHKRIDGIVHRNIDPLIVVGDGLSNEYQRGEVLPSTQKLRKHLKMARSIISREIDRRALIRAGKLTGWRMDGHSRRSRIAINASMA
jgi:hypothetical protein